MLTGSRLSNQISTVAAFWTSWPKLSNRHSIIYRFPMFDYCSYRFIFRRRNLSNFSKTKSVCIYSARETTLSKSTNQSFSRTYLRIDALLDFIPISGGGPAYGFGSVKTNGLWCCNPQC